MAHFAEIGLNNTVLRVIVVHNNELLDESGQESEAKGAEFCRSLFGGTWLQTSYNGTIRKNYAGVGFTYDSQRDAFIAPQPYPSWILNETTCTWESPVPYPQLTPNGTCTWDESKVDWVTLDFSSALGGNVTTAFSTGV